MSLPTSIATTVACRSRRPGGVSTVVLDRASPATTWALVTTSCRRTTQPDPSTPRPHDSPVIRTTDWEARATAGRWRCA